MTPNFEYYKIFFYVAKYQNLTLAAKVLLTSQPSVTRSIKSLENDLGCRLFIRSRRGVTLTAEGELLYAHVAAACESLFKGEAALSDALSLQNGSVSIGATETAAHCLLLEKLEEFHRRFPQVRINIRSDSTAPVIGDLKSGRVDLAVVTTPMEKEPYLKAVTVRTFHDILVAGPGFAELKGREYHLFDLTGYPLVCLSPETMTNRFYVDFYAAHGISMKSDIQLATADLLLPVIEKNLGIGFVPEGMAEEALRRGSVFRVELNEKIPARQICAVRDTQRPLSAAARQLLKLLRG